MEFGDTGYGYSNPVYSRDKLHNGGCPIVYQHRNPECDECKPIPVVIRGFRPHTSEGWSREQHDDLSLVPYFRALDKSLGV